MRFAIDARLVSYIQGGTSRYTVSLVQAMAELCSKDEMIILESRKAEDQDLWPKGVKRGKLMTPPHHRLEQITLPLELLRFGPDLLHSPDFIPPFRRPCRSVVTIHDLAFLRFPGLLTPESTLYYSQVGRAVRSAEAVIAVSEATRQDILEILDADPDRVHVVFEAASRDCVPLERVVIERHRERLRLPKRFVLFVGTIEPRKNLPVLLKAYVRVWEQEGVPLVIVGRKGWLYEETFQTLESLGLGDAVQFVGPVGGNELVYYYNCAECLVMPSLYEGFGLPVLEAMACGTPVVVSNVSSLPEIAGDAALKFDPSNVEALSEILCEVLSESSMRTIMRDNGFKRAAEFSWERAARETLAVYRRTLS